MELVTWVMNGRWRGGVVGVGETWWIGGGGESGVEWRGIGVDMMECVFVFVLISRGFEWWCGYHHGWDVIDAHF